MCVLTFMQHGTMMLVMGSLSEEMKVRPRYWERLLMVYATTIQAEDTPAVMVQVNLLPPSLPCHVPSVRVCVLAEMCVLCDGSVEDVGEFP